MLLLQPSWWSSNSHKEYEQKQISPIEGFAVWQSRLFCALQHKHKKVINTGWVKMIKEQTWDKKNRPIKMEILECLLYPIFYPHTHFLCLISSCGCSSLDICIFLKTHFVEGDTPGNVWSVHYEINLVFLQDKIGLPWEIKKEMTRSGGGKLILFQWLEWNSFHGIWLCNPLKCKHKSALEIRRRSARVNHLWMKGSLTSSQNNYDKFDTFRMKGAAHD